MNVLASGQSKSGLMTRMKERAEEIGYRGLAITAGIVVLSSIYFVYDKGWRLFFSRLVDGVGNGFVYGAVALALVLIYKATGVINFAQGSMAMFFTFIAWVLAREQSWPVWLSILTAMLLSAAFGAGFERVFIRPFDPQNHLPIFIVTLALLSFIEGLALFIWFADPKAFPSPFPSRPLEHYIELFGKRIFYMSIGIWLTVIVTTIAVTMLLNKTKIGLAFRAVSSNLESSKLVGIDVGKTLQFGWALAAAIGTLAGCLVLSDATSFLDPSFMAKVLVFSFAAATIGGLDSISGAVVGGLLVGLLQTMLGGYVPFIGSELVLAVTLLIIIVVLLVKPAGLFGKTRVERV